MAAAGLLKDLEAVAVACEAAKGHAPLSDTELDLRAFIRTHHAEIAEAVRELHIRRLELAHARACREQLAQHLSSIYALLYPAPVEADGETYKFRPRLIDPHELMQELSDRIRAIPAAIDAQYNSARETHR